MGSDHTPALDVLKAVEAGAISADRGAALLSQLNTATEPTEPGRQRAQPEHTDPREVAAQREAETVLAAMKRDMPDRFEEAA